MITLQPERQVHQDVNDKTELTQINTVTDPTAESRIRTTSISASLRSRHIFSLQ